MAGQLIMNYVVGVCPCAFLGLCTYSIVAQVTIFTLISFLAFWYSNVILRQLHCKYLCAYLLPSPSLSLCVCAVRCANLTSLCMHVGTLSFLCLCQLAPIHRESAVTSLPLPRPREGREAKEEGRGRLPVPSSRWMAWACLVGWLHVCSKCAYVLYVHICVYIRMCMYIGMYVYT